MKRSVWSKSLVGAVGGALALTLGLAATRSEAAQAAGQPSFTGKIATSGYSCLTVDASGAVWGWGDNELGELGDGTLTSRSAPARASLPAGTRAAGVATGSHSMAVTTAGDVYAWGENWRDYLGLGDISESPVSVPVKVPGISGVTAVAAGGYHFSFALTSAGALYAWGNGFWGQLGLGDNSDRLTPAKVNGLPFATSVAAGFTHSLAVTAGGDVYAWGQNEDGQLGLGDRLNRSSPVKVPGLSDVVQVAAGADHSLAVTAGGDVYAWGHNEDGQVGDGTNATRMTPARVFTGAIGVAAGAWHSLAVTAPGQVYAWGAGSDGQLGNGTEQYRNRPAPVDGMTGAAAVAGGWWHSLALTPSGQPWSWGYNGHGELGDRSTDLADRGVPKQRPAGLVVAVTPAGAIGSVSISGFALTGSTLTANATGVNPSDASLAYQWLRAGQNVQGATAKTYKLVAADQGKQISAKVTASKPGWTVASKTSAAVTPGAAAPPANCGLKQVVLSPRLMAAGSNNGVGDGQVVRVCANGDLWLYDLVGNKLAGRGKAGSGFGDVTVYAPGDWNKDGFNDLIGIDKPGLMWLYKGQAAGGFAAKQRIGSGWGGFKTVVPVGDITGDGNPDLLAVQKDGIMKRYEGNGRGGWKNSPGTRAGSGWRTVDLLPAGDVTGDGNSDIFGISRKTGELNTYAGRGNGGFRSKVLSGTGWRTVNATGGASLNGDPHADLIGVGTDGAVNFYRGRGNSTFAITRNVATNWK
ncbi:MAG: FG-GAP-like repeat-containing protein [Bifidobacteriaceae bacterium]|nr:FG-GAP-like repeat-containing protein [Bifidobacteriaceae bacterium]